MVEPETENISIGAPLPGIVVEVMVKVGQRVKAGDPLFRIDDREQKAELTVRQAMLADATGGARTTGGDAAARGAAGGRGASPRGQGRLGQLGAAMVPRRKAGHQQSHVAKRSSQERKQSAIQARERYNKRGGRLTICSRPARGNSTSAWPSRRSSAQSRRSKQAQTELDRLTVRALVDGEVLQVNVRPGEFVGAPPGQALIVLGSVTQLHVRVDIDEYDIPRFVPDAPARATLKGQPDGFFPLQVRADRAVRGAQEVAHGRQHGARRHPRAAGDLRDRHAAASGCSWGSSWMCLLMRQCPMPAKPARRP